MVPSRDRWIATERGRLFAREWTRGGAGVPPLLLLHDSLGCVELWRDFPARLADATGRPVLTARAARPPRAVPRRQGPLGARRLA